MKQKNMFKSVLIPTAVALSFFSNPSIAVDTFSPGVKKLMSDVIKQGKVRIIVNLTPPELLSSVVSISGKEHDKVLSIAIAQIQQNVLDRMVVKGEKIDNLTKFRYTPQMALAVTKKGLNALKSDPNVVQVHEDSLHQGSVGNSIPKIFPSYQTSPYSGEGWTVAVLDSGVDTSHSAFGNRVVYEACFSANSTGPNGIPFNNYYSLCPNGEAEATGEGSGINCHNRLEELKTELGKEEDEEGTSCGHGTAVASVAVGDFGDMQGVAKDAGLMAIQVFTAVDNDNTIGAFAFSSDIMKGLERVYELRDTHHIASINLSISGEGEIATVDQCRNALGPNDEGYDALRPGIELLRQAGIATVIASGNENFPNAVGGIACIDSAITVGAVDNNDDLYAFTNRGLLLDLFAPGVGIITADAGGELADPTQGTSYAAPHVAGAWAVIKQSKPDASVDEIEKAFKTTGKVIITEGDVTTQRINIDEALNVLSDDPGTEVPTEIEDACQQGHFADDSLKAGEAVCIPHFSNGGQFQSEIYVPNDKVGSTMEIILRYGTGNGNLLHRHDNRPTRTVFDHISDNTGNEERILVENVQERWNYIHVRADTEFSDVTLLVRFVEGSTPPLTPSPSTPDIQIDDACQQGQSPVGNVELFAGNVVCLQDVSNRGARQMALYVTDDKVGSTLEILLSHGSGNGSLLHRYDSRPNDSVFDHISNTSGNEERIRVDNVKGGWNYIHVDGDTAFTGVSLLPRFIE